MSDKDQNDKPESDPSEADEDLENLSSEEKAAFEKIMSQIESTDDGAAADAVSPQPTPEATASKIHDSLKSQVSGDVTPDATASKDDGAGETLSEDEQAALDKIMAEIGADSASAEEPPGAAEPGASAIEEQPFDKETPFDLPDPGPAQDAVEKQDAPGDQQDEAGEEALSDDQQDALNKIMAEINGDEKAPSDLPDPGAAQGAVGKQDPSGNQQDEAGEEEKPPPTPASEENDQKAHLSIGEFNDELTSLLAGAPEGEQPEEKIPASAPVPSTEPPEPADSAGDDAEIQAAETVSSAGTSPVGVSTKPNYRMLQEVVPQDLTKRRAGRSGETSPKRSRRPKMTRTTSVTGIVLLVIIVSGAGYWGFRQWKQNNAIALSPASISGPLSAPFNEAPLEDLSGSLADQTDAPSSTQHTSAAIPAQMATAPEAPLSALATELEMTMDRLDGKIKEINELIAYYDNGIGDEQDKIEAVLQSATIKSVSQALENSQINLSLQAIQRRLVYQAKLEVPLAQLRSLSEEVLYLQRKGRLLSVLSSGLSGLPIQEFKQDVARVVQRQIKESSSLSVDHIAVKTPSAEKVWKGVQDRIKTGAAKSETSNVLTGTDQEIAKEICSGNFERMALLTALNPETASCLSQWHGKDMFLNNLTQLTPGSAKALAQWQGDWLSLNGIRELSSQSAGEIAQWDGRRLSMNGLLRLTGKSTAELSKWNGDQLELVGLKSIGGWKNYSTRLYLSEDLQRKLQVQ
jgi:hypothetical protein